MVDPNLDTNTGIDEANKSSGDTDEVGRSSVRGTSVAGDVSDETSANDESGLSSDGTEGVHGVDDLEHGLRASETKRVRCVERVAERRSQSGRRRGEV